MGSGAPSCHINLTIGGLLAQHGRKDDDDEDHGGNNDEEALLGGHSRRETVVEKPAKRWHQVKNIVIEVRFIASVIVCNKLSRLLAERTNITFHDTRPTLHRPFT